MRSRRTLPVLAAFAPMLLLAATAAAHASLVASEPPDGGSIQRTPATLTATFDEALGTDRSRIVVENSAGVEVARGGISPDDPQVMQVELPPLPPGSYEAKWVAVTPEDGGVTRGIIDFTIEPPPASPSPTISPTAVASPTGASPAPGPTATARPAATAGPTATAMPAVSPSPSPSPVPSTTGTDLLIALALAAVALGAIGLFLFRRSGA